MIKSYKSIASDGAETWFTNRLKYHRIDGPAYIGASGLYKAWYFDGKRHRLDGPAIERAVGQNQWWIDGKKIDCSSQEEFKRIMKLKAFW